MGEETSEVQSCVQEENNGAKNLWNSGRSGSKGKDVISNSQRLFNSFK